jgi:hypothetical protein
MTTPAPRWSIKVFTLYWGNAVENPEGHKLPEGWEPVKFEDIGGNQFRVYARRRVA